jgi:hypothetical protein
MKDKHVDNRAVVYVCMHMRKKKETQRITKNFDCCSAFFDLNKLKPDYKNRTIHNIIVRSETSEMNK